MAIITRQEFESLPGVMVQNVPIGHGTNWIAMHTDVKESVYKLGEVFRRFREELTGEAYLLRLPQPRLSVREKYLVIHASQRRRDA